MTLAVAALVRGEAPSPPPRPRSEPWRTWSGEELEFLVEAAGRSRPVDGPDQGFCLFTAGLAFQSLLAGGDAETELRRIVALGGDADERGRRRSSSARATASTVCRPAARLRDADRSARPRISCPRRHTAGQQ